MSSFKRTAARANNRKKNKKLEEVEIHDQASIRKMLAATNTESFATEHKKISKYFKENGCIKFGHYKSMVEANGSAQFVAHIEEKVNDRAGS